MKVLVLVYIHNTPIPCNCWKSQLSLLHPEIRLELQPPIPIAIGTPNACLPVGRGDFSNVFSNLTVPLSPPIGGLGGWGVGNFRFWKN